MTDRCRRILEILGEADQAVSASTLAETLSVSRQVIVNDVALLRASGEEVVATSRGYVLGNHNKYPFPFVGALVCRHTAGQLMDELYTIVDMGGTVIDVSIDHPIYGELCGSLDLASRYDVDQFLRKVNEDDAAPISSLTGGVHMHRIGCASREVFDRIRDRLTQQGIVHFG